MISNDKAGPGARGVEFKRRGWALAAMRTVEQLSYAACSAVTPMRADSICVRRIGRKTNQAINAATAFMMLAVMKTACQLPVIVVNTLDKGTSSDAVPLAV